MQSHPSASESVAAGVSAATTPGQEMTTKGKKILLIDDDASLRNVLVEQLELYDGFVTIQAASGAEGLEIAKKQLFDAILLDVALPDGDGRDICKLMRREGVRAPILM